MVGLREDMVLPLKPHFLKKSGQKGPLADLGPAVGRHFGRPVPGAFPRRGVAGNGRLENPRHRQAGKPARREDTARQDAGALANDQRVRLPFRLRSAPKHHFGATAVGRRPQFGERGENHRRDLSEMNLGQKEIDSAGHRPRFFPLTIHRVWGND